MIVVGLLLRSGMAYRRVPAPLPVREIASRIAAAEATPTGQPVHQEFRLIATQVRPSRMDREMRMELWTDSQTQRFTMQVKRRGGNLAYAIWQPEQDRAFVYNANLTSGAVRISRTAARDQWDDIIFRDDLDLDTMEAGLMTWLQRREWRPISLASNLTLFAGEGSAVAMAEETGCCARLTVRKKQGSVTVEFVLEAEKRDYRPRLLSIHYTATGRALELTFYPVASTERRTASYTPPQSLMPPMRAAPRAAALPVPPILDVTRLEVETFYALHRVGACRGEPIEVSRTDVGNLHIQGVPATAERRDELYAALSLLDRSRISIELKSAGELLAELRASTPPITHPSGSAPVHGRKRPVLEAIAQRFGGQERAAYAFVDKSLSMSGNLVLEAQALLQLAARFDPAGVALPAQSAPLLELMLRDHLESLERKTVEFQRYLEVGFGARDRTFPDLRVPAGITERQNWAAAMRQVFDAAKRADDATRNALLTEDNMRLGEIAQGAWRELASLDSVVHSVAGGKLELANRN